MAESEAEKKKREAAEAKEKEKKGSESEEADDDDDAGETDEDLSPEEQIKLLKADVAKWKALSKKHEKRAKDNADAKKKLDDIEAKGKTDTEKASAAEDRAKKAEREALISRIALRKGLTETQAKRLVGESEEDLESDADELLKTFKGEEEDDDDDSQNGKTRRQKRPSENLRMRTSSKTGAQGSDKEPLPSKDEIKKIVDRSMENRY